MNALTTAERFDSGAFINSTGHACPHCGASAHVELIEIWGHDFQIDACCEEHLDEVHRWMAADPLYAKQLLSSLVEDAVPGQGVRRIVDTDISLRLDYDLRVVPVSRRDAMAFIARHHHHVGSLPGDRFRAAIWNGPTMLGVVVIGNPTARAYNHKGIVEVRRLCLNLGISELLRWKACSALYVWAAEESARRGWRKIITYTLASESGMSLRYARWTREGQTGGGSRSWANRAGRQDAPREPKVRWSRDLTAHLTASRAHRLAA